MAISEVDFEDYGLGEEQEYQESSLDKLARYLESPNIAEELGDDVLGNMARRVIDEYEIDVNSRADWTKQNEDALKLAKQTVEEKTYPWPKAANVKFPLITSAAIQFQARAYPAIVDGHNIVKCRVNGFDPDGQKRARADRVGKYMSYQLLEEMPEWEEETDKLLVVVPICGMAFRKSYFDPGEGRNVSEFVLPQNLVFNYGAKSFDRCPRKTQEVELYPYEIQERVNAGTYLNQDYGLENENLDSSAPQMFLEQHCLWDLDGDGYEEPYIVTVHKDSAKVARIVARFRPDGVKVRGESVYKIEPVEYFTKYGFLPNPDGSAHDIGFGVLMGPLNESVNTSLNQMLDAGHLQNTGGGFIGSGLRMKGGPVRFSPGKFHPLDVPGGKIRENIYHMQFPGPSAVLFNLLGFLVEAAREIGSIKDILTGNPQGANTPVTTTLALIEQGLKVFTAIYKRIHRSLRSELIKLYKLNAEYLPQSQYVTFLDAQVPTQVLLEDFRDGDLDVVPVSDPNVVTESQRIARAEVLMQFRGDPMFNGQEITRRYLEAAGIADIPSLLATPEQQQGASESQRQQLALMLTQLENETKKADAALLKAMTGGVLDVAKAEAEEAGIQIQQYQAFVQSMHQQIEQMRGIVNDQNDRRAMGGVGQPSGNTGVPSIPIGLPGVG